MPLDPSHEKGKNARCADHPYVGGIPTLAGETIWRRTGDTVERVKSPKQLTESTYLLVQAAGRHQAPPPEWFDEDTARPAGVWGAVTSPDSMDAHGQKGPWRGSQSASTSKRYPHLAGRLTSHSNASVRQVAHTRPRLAITSEPAKAKAAANIADLCAREGGRALVVGGAVRDAAIAFRTGSHVVGKDVDIEVFGIAPEHLQSMLAEHYRLDVTGVSFAVLNLHGLDIDVSLPRRESKSGSGHKGFIVESDPHMSVEAAAQRRDFTINALSFDPLTGELVDPVGGIADLEAGILRHIGPQFAEDPLRVLRGAQFLARFELRAHPGTVALCASLRNEADTLARERIYDEVQKLLLRGTKPSLGLHFLDNCNWIDIFPELAATRKVEQNPKWHPEGDVFVHTAYVMDAWTKLRTGNDEEDIITGLAALCHDYGKPATTEFKDGNWKAHSHESAGVEPTREFLARLTNETGLAGQITPLVQYHLAPVTLFAEQASDTAIRRLANKVGRIDRLVTVAHADQAGRPPLVVDRFEAGEWLLERAASLGVADQVLQPLVMGRDLIEHYQMKPGPQIGKVLKQLFAAQEAGEFTTAEAGLAMAATLIDS